MPLSSKLGSLAVKAITKLVGMPAMLVAVKPDGKADAIQLQYNPSEFKITERSNYAERERNRKDDPVVSFTGKPMSTLNMKLYFNADEPISVSSAMGAIAGAVKSLVGADATPSKDSIEKTIGKISALTMIEGDVHSPPNALFFWGSIVFLGYVQSVTTSYTMFDKSGKVLRATVDLTMIGYNNVNEERSSPLQSPDRTKAQTLTEDSSIFEIAEREYGDAREWRRIADANGIMNPLDIKVGRTLRVPSINDFD